MFTEIQFLSTEKNKTIDSEQWNKWKQNEFYIIT